MFDEVMYEFIELPSKILYEEILVEEFFGDSNVSDEYLSESGGFLGRTAERLKKLGNLIREILASIAKKLRSAVGMDNSDKGNSSVVKEFFTAIRNGIQKIVQVISNPGALIAIASAIPVITAVVLGIRERYNKDRQYLVGIHSSGALHDAKKILEDSEAAARKISSLHGNERRDAEDRAETEKYKVAAARNIMDSASAAHRRQSQHVAKGSEILAISKLVSTGIGAIASIMFIMKNVVV